MKTASIFNLLILFATVGCGVVSSKDLEGLGVKSDKETTGTEQSAVNRPMVNVSVGIKNNVKSAALYGFSLVDATAVNISVKGCKSGWEVLNASAAAKSVAVKMYQKDVLCLAELNSFAYNAKTYIPVDGTPLTGVADTAENYKNQLDANDLLMVRVHSQLPSPMTDAQTALFVFQEIVGTQTHNIDNYSNSETLQVQGIEAPNFFIQNVVINSIDGVTGTATYDVTFECNAVMAQNGADWYCPSPGGDNEPIKDMKAIIVKDTYANTPLWADALTIVSGTTTAVTNAMKVGGQNRFTISLVGPGQLMLNLNMIVMLQYIENGPLAPPSKGMSFRYFNMDIGNPNQD